MKQEIHASEHISRTTELTKSNLFIYLYTLSVGLKYQVVTRSAECCTQFSRERDQQSAYFPTDDIFLNFGSNSRLAVYSKPDSVWEPVYVPSIFSVSSCRSRSHSPGGSVWYRVQGWMYPLCPLCGLRRGLGLGPGGGQLHLLLFHGAEGHGQVRLPLAGQLHRACGHWNMGVSQNPCWGSHWEIWVIMMGRGWLTEAHPTNLHCCSNHSIVT